MRSGKGSCGELEIPARPGPACPACGGQTAAWRWARSADAARGAPAGSGGGGDAARGASAGSAGGVGGVGGVDCYLLDRCSACGLVALDDPDVTPNADALYETGAYRPGKPRMERVASPLLSLFDRQRLALLGGAVPPGGRILDVGAGRGRFLGALGRAGYDAAGIEPSERGYRACLERGVRVTKAGIEHARIEAASLDGVVLWHVLEHMRDPRAALERVGEWLVPGGTLLVGVPNFASIQSRLGRDAWLHLDLPRHIFHFNPVALDLLLGRCGFSSLSVHHLLIEHNMLGAWQTALNCVTPTPNFLYAVLKRNLGRLRAIHLVDAAITALAGPLLLPVAAAGECLAGAAGRGGTIAVVARRDA